MPLCLRYTKLKPYHHAAPDYVQEEGIPSMTKAVTYRDYGQFSASTFTLSIQFYNKIILHRKYNKKKILRYNIRDSETVLNIWLSFIYDIKYYKWQHGVYTTCNETLSACYNINACGTNTVVKRIYGVATSLILQYMYYTR